MDSAYDPMRRGEQRHEVDVLILGPVPPPFGGVSAHLSRLVPLLKSAGLNVAVLNHFSSTEGREVVGVMKRNPLNYYRLPKRFRPRVVHYHHARWVHLLATALGKGGSDARYILTLHGGVQHRSPLTSRNKVIRRITRWALRRFDTVIVVNPRFASAVQDHLDKQRIEVLPAFVEAVNDQHDRYEPAIEAFLNGGRVLVVSAYAIQFLDGDRELYGLDIAIEAFVNVASGRADLRLAIFVARRPSRPKARRHLASLKRRLEDAGLEQRALIVFGLPLLPALRPNVIFVRPTRVEGDAVSIREAQAAGVPVVASNVVRRPSGVVLFQTEDATDFCHALRAVLDNATPRRTSPQGETGPTPVDEFAEGLIRIYRRELAAQAGE